jgi:hypothetical protein
MPTTLHLAGGAKETAGFEIRTGTKVWDHVQELKDASRGLARGQPEWSMKKTKKN